MDDETILNKNRIEALTDGVFAVVMTLLVLDISVPQISSHYAIDSVAAGTELLKRLFDLWPKILSFGISFVILAIYWVAHHRQFHYIKHSNRALIWINIMFLMATCLAVITNISVRSRQVIYLLQIGMLHKQQIKMQTFLVNLCQIPL
jgi:uncharacterized membrane protein